MLRLKRDKALRDKKTMKVKERVEARSLGRILNEQGKVQNLEMQKEKQFEKMMKQVEKQMMDEITGEKDVVKKERLKIELGE